MDVCSRTIFCYDEVSVGLKNHSLLLELQWSES